MKNLYAAGFLGLLIFLSVQTTAQDAVSVKQQVADKPLLFSQLPEKIACSKQELLQLLQQNTSSSVVLKLGSTHSLAGIIAEKIQRTANTHSINIKLSSYPGALFNLSITRVEGRPDVIRGRIIHPQSGDVLILVEENQQYYLQKQLQKYFMTE